MPAGPPGDCASVQTEPVYLSWLYVSNNTQDGDYNDYNPPCTSTDSWFGFGIFYLSCGACGFGGPAPILSPTPSPSPDPIAVPTYPASPSPDPIAVPTYAASPIPAPVYPTHAPCGPGTYSPCPGSPTLSPKPSPGPEPTAVVDYTPAPAPVYPTPTPTSTPSPSRNPFVRGFPYSDCTNRNVTLSQYRVRNPFGPIDVPAGDFDAPAVRYCMDIVSVGTCDDRSRCCGMQLYKLQLLIRKSTCMNKNVVPMQVHVNFMPGLSVDVRLYRATDLTALRMHASGTRHAAHSYWPLLPSIANTTIAPGLHPAPIHLRSVPFRTGTSALLSSHHASLIPHALRSLRSPFHRSPLCSPRPLPRRPLRAAQPQAHHVRNCQRRGG